jgi:xanthine dehydrogenase iron-sulfur cluster and FAD-binding subunit A
MSAVAAVEEDVEDLREFMSGNICRCAAYPNIVEIGVVGVAAAVANAICNATGIRVRHIPIIIEDLLA